MKNTRVVNLGSVKNLLSEWDKVRQAIVGGHVTGFQTTLMTGEESAETVYLGGIYNEDPKRALSAILKTSAARVLHEDPPLRAASNM